MKTLHIVIIAIALYTIVFHLVAGASEKEHDHQTINNIVHKHEHNDLGKGIAIGIIATCGLRSLYYGFKDKRWTWCGEPKPKPDLPKPGPALNDVTPDRPVGVKLYQ